MSNKLEILQALDLETKIMMSKKRIREWYHTFGGEVYVSFSGGKDSTVLLHLVRSLFPEVPAVFVDTGLEYPEIREFVKSTENVTWLRPKFTFKEVVEKYGYPTISKEQSQYIYQYKTAKSEKTKDTRLNGNKYGRGRISEKWKPFLESSIKISDNCCNIMKKTPSKEYEEKTGKVPFIGTMAEESKLRQSNWVRYGCNSFETERKTSKPLSFWKEEDIWEYIKKYNVPYSKIYDMGYKRTGCTACLFGIHLEKDKNRLQLMKKTHPKMYNYIINNLGAGEIIKFMNKNCNCNIKIDNVELKELKLF